MINHHGFFITGTDTDAGKTVVTAALLTLLRARGIDAVPFKPVQTGCELHHGVLVPPDPVFCLRLAGLPTDAATLAPLTAYGFAPPCSPHLAAAQAGVRLSIPLIRRACQRVAAVHELVLVEGAGGILAPLSRRRTMLDLMQALGLPVILAARPGLGTINHTLLSLQALRAAGLQVAGVVFCETRNRVAGAIEHDNRKTIATMGKVRVLGCLPFLSGLAEGALAPAAFLAACEAALAAGLHSVLPPMILPDSAFGPENKWVTKRNDTMAKSHDAKKDVKKKSEKTLKEKRLAKKAKKAGKSFVTT